MHRRPHPPLEAAIDHLAALVEAEDNPDEFALWTVANLCHRLGLTFALSDAASPNEAIIEVGEVWAALVAERLDAQPEQTAATLRASKQVVEELLGAVERRGLAEIPYRAATRTRLV